LNVDLIDGVVLNSKVLMRHRFRCGVSLLSKQVKSAKTKDPGAGDKKSQTSSGASVSKAASGTAGKPVDAQKFELYFDFKAYISAINPHQVLTWFSCF